MQLPQELEILERDLFQAILDQVSDAIIFVDRHGTVRLWSRGAEAIFGYSAAEMLGNSLDVIIPERLRSAHWEGFRRAINTAQTKHRGRVLTTRSVHKYGSKHYVDLSFGLVKDQSGVVAGAFAIGRDCTARYLAESALKARVAELEGQLATLSKPIGGAPTHSDSV
jgi:PAS domain S-box-containing protein